MINYENECICCGIVPCLGNACPNRHIKKLYCDECGDEVKKLYIVDGAELCADCALTNLDWIE